MGRTRDEVLNSLPVAPGEFVVDVGGGHRPFPRADVVFEKYPFEEVHRVAAHGLVHSAPVMIADATKIPVPDNVAGLVFASHVIEHLPDPDAFLREVQRCSSRAYIEVPTLTRELMFAWGFHEWYVHIEGSHITFFRNDIPQLMEDFFHRGYDFLADAWHMQRHELLNQWYHGPAADLTWEIAEQSAFEFAIARAPTGRAKVSAAPVDRVPYSLRQIGVVAAEKLLPESVLRKALGAVRSRRTSSVKPVKQSLADRLMCISCDHAGLKLNGAELTCGSCGTTYRQRNGLFDLDIESLAQRVS